jgi:hypothetical protein
MNDDSVLHKEMDGFLRIKHQQTAPFPRLRQAQEGLAEGS